MGLIVGDRVRVLRPEEYEASKGVTARSGYYGISRSIITEYADRYSGLTVASLSGGACKLMTDDGEMSGLFWPLYLLERVGDEESNCEGAESALEAGIDGLFVSLFG